MKKSIGKFGTILIILVTVILAGVAIFTALRLYQLRQQPVAPNVPTSKPEAATVCTDDVNPVACPDGSHQPRDPKNNCQFKPCPGSCSIGFTIAPSQCNGACATDTDCQSSSTTNSTEENTSKAATTTSPTLICFQPAATPCPEKACVTVLPPKVCRNTLCTSEEDCICSTPTPKATPTPTVTPGTTPNPSGTPNSCGGTCGSNTNCGSGLYCYTSVGLCRNPSCPTEADCNCPNTPTPGTGTTTPGATPAPSLPVSGTDWPTIFGAGIGLFVIIGSLLLAL